MPEGAAKADAALGALIGEVLALAAEVAGAPLAVAALADGRQWRRGGPESGPEGGLGAGPLDLPPLEGEALRVLADLSLDPGHAAGALAAEGVRFAAGAAIRGGDGGALGALWVLDRRARPEGLDGTQARLLGALARQVAAELELRGAAAAREAEVARLGAAREQLRAQADELAAIYAAAPVGLTVLDRDLRYLRINERLAEINGVPAADHIGRTVQEVVPDLGDQAVAAMKRVLAGEALIGLEFTGTTPAASGVVRTWRENWVPMRDARGEIVGITISAEEITAEKAAERRQAFRLGLTEALRDLGEAEAMMDEAVRRLGLHLGVAQAGFGEVEPDGAHAVVRRAWSDGRTGSAVGRWRLDDFGRTLIDEMRRGATVSVPDVGEDERTRAAEVAAAYGALGVRSMIDVPLVRDGRMAALLFVHHPEPRAWTPEEVALVEETCERLWAAVERARAEGRLRASEARFRAVVEQSPLLVHVFDPEGRTLLANPALLRALDMPAEAALGYNVLEDPFPGLNGTRGALERLFRDGEVMRTPPIRHQAALLAGARRSPWIETVGFPVRDEAGRLSEVVFLSQDVSDRVAAEAALRESEEALRTRLDAIPQMVWSARADGVHDFFSDRWRELTGVAPGEGPGEARGDLGEEGWSALAHPEDRGRVWAVWQHSLETGEDFEIECRLRHRGGGWRWVLARALPIRDEGGSVARWMGTCTDIDELKRATDELRRVSALLQLIGDATPDMILATDRRGRALYANAAAARLTGRTPEGRPGEGQGDGHGDGPGDGDRRVIETGDTLESDEEMEGPDGRRRLIRSIKAPLRDGEGLVIGVVTVASDVTARREAEERERLLAREVDHRAKNLLAVIQSVLQLTRAEDIAGFKAAVSGRIQSLGRAHSLLAAARWEGIEVRQLVAEELEPFARGATGGTTGGTGGRVGMEGPRLRLGPAAAQALALVLHEIATNAAKYGSLSVEAGRVDVAWRLEGGRFELSWRERGGPPPAPPGRRGFGSSLIRTAVERQLGGELEMHWAPEGLSVRLAFGAEQLGELPASGPAPAPSGPPAAPPEGALAGRRVLVVEDEALIAMQAGEAVASLGGRVLGPAASVAEALRLLEAERPDAAVLDLNLGGERSDRVAERLRALGVPFLIATGYAEGDVPGSLAGAPRLAKPIEPERLAATLAGLVAPDPPQRNS